MTASMTIGPLPTRAEALAFLFCLVWPFIAYVLMRRRVQWRMFLPAVLAPVVVSAAVALIELRLVLSVAPGARDVAIGNALETIQRGLWSATVVAVIALVQRRRCARRLQM